MNVTKKAQLNSYLELVVELLEGEILDRRELAFAMAIAAVGQGDLRAGQGGEEEHRGGAFAPERGGHHCDSGLWELGGEDAMHAGSRGKLARGQFTRERGRPGCGAFVNWLTDQPLVTAERMEINYMITTGGGRAKTRVHRAEDWSLGAGCRTETLGCGSVGVRSGLPAGDEAKKGRESRSSIGH